MGLHTVFDVKINRGTDPRLAPCGSNFHLCLHVKEEIVMQISLFADAATDIAEGTESFLTQAVEFLADKSADFAINVVMAILIFIIGRWVAKMMVGVVRKLMQRGNIDETLTKFLANIVYSLLLVFVVLAAIDQLGVNTTSLSAILAAMGLAVGLALQSSLSNFASGVMLILFKPFSVGDFVEAGGTAGVIEEIHIFNTLMLTGDNCHIVVPNGQITSSTITNYSAKPTRRIDLVIGCGYGDDLKAVKQFLEETIRSDERVLSEPASLVAVDELGDSSVNFVVRPWVKNADYWAVRRELTEKIKIGFDAHGFSIPYPTQDLHLHQTAAAES